MLRYQINAFPSNGRVKRDLRAVIVIYIQFSIEYMTNLQLKLFGSLKDLIERALSRLSYDVF